jgi:hypothetical protein
MEEAVAAAAAALPQLPEGEDSWHLYVHKLRVWTPLPAAAASAAEEAEVELAEARAAWPIPILSQLLQEAEVVRGTLVAA